MEREWKPKKDPKGNEHGYAIQSGEWVITKYFMPEPIYTLWRGTTRIESFPAAEMAKAAVPTNTTEPIGDD